MAGREQRHRKREGKKKKRRFASPSSNSSGNLEKVDESETFDISDTDCMLGWLSIGVFILLLL